MIGNRIWSTGITISSYDGWEDRFRVSLDFHDSGFATDGTIQGKLEMRYNVKKQDLEENVRMLKEDAEKLGIEWKTPTVYADVDGYEYKDGELTGDFPERRTLANALAKSLDWEWIYR